MKRWFANFRHALIEIERPNEAVTIILQIPKIVLKRRNELADIVKILKERVYFILRDYLSMNNC